ncbi:lytic transglycosylase domain-containing protein [Streptomyces sp. NPDC049099]|uniref:lytic transglycosylase domain-containing protein n=1 Tax=Streptomyces sp. NPDC049099 TaxID=3155768 RepID=UPI003441249C
MHAITTGDLFSKKGVFVFRSSLDPRFAVRTGALALTLAAACATQAGTATAAAAGCPQYASTFKSAASANGVSWQLLSAMARVESGCNPSARAADGRVGLFQQRPTAGVDLRSAAGQAKAAAKFLSGAKRQVGSRPDLLAASWNAGVAAVKRYGGIPPYRETRDYVARVMTDYRALTH